MTKRAPGCGNAPRRRCAGITGSRGWSRPPRSRAFCTAASRTSALRTRRGAWSPRCTTRSSVSRTRSSAMGCGPARSSASIPPGSRAGSASACSSACWPTAIRPGAGVPGRHHPDTARQLLLAALRTSDGPQVEVGWITEGQDAVARCLRRSVVHTRTPLTSKPSRHMLREGFGVALVEPFARERRRVSRSPQGCALPRSTQE